MNCKKGIMRWTALLITAGMLSHFVSPVSADAPAPGELHGSYLYLYAQEDDVQDGETAPEMSVVQASRLPLSYDLRDEGCVTPVRNQGTEGMCFAFSAIGACESNLLKQGLKADWSTLDLSEAHLGYFLYTQQEDPLDPLYGDYIDASGKGSSGGNGMLAAAGIASGMGTQLEQFCAYDDWDSGYSAYQRYGGQYRLRTMETVTRVTTDTERNTIKKWLMESGGVGVAFYSKRSLYYDNGTSYAYYAANKSFYKDANHAALIVGWDDDYSRENFSEENRPDYDGAWLVKNSYGVDLFDDGYFWLSYEDPSTGSFCRYELDPLSMYDDVYEYDGAGYITAYNYDAAANIFVAENDCTLTKAAFYMSTGNSSGSSYEIDVYLLEENTTDPMDGIQVASVSGKTLNNGYYTVALDQPVSLSKGQQFSLVLRIKNEQGQNGYLAIEENSSINSNFALHYHADPGESYILSENEWVDTTTMKGEYGAFGNIPLKAFAQRTETGEPLRLNTALSLAEQAADAPGEVLTEAIRQGQTVRESGSGTAAHTYASATLLSVLETEIGSPQFPEYLYADFDEISGDSNQNGSIEIADATEVLKIYASRSVGQMIRLRQGETYAMDVVTDGTIDLNDASEILQRYAKAAAGNNSS